jgi:hypothetical protein
MCNLYSITTSQAAIIAQRQDRPTTIDLCQCTKAIETTVGAAK